LKLLWKNSGLQPSTSSLAKAIGYATTGVLILICVVGSTVYLREVLALFRLDENGYGDSYILYDVLHFKKTGIIYRDLSQRPYVPAQYSPLVYILYSLPGRLIYSENPFVAPRLVALLVFLLCIGVVTSIVRKLIPSRLAWVWGVLLAFTPGSMPEWILQLRADFAGSFLNLLSIRFLLSDSRWAVLLAGICAGLAMQCKITFVAAAVTGIIWLLTQRRWRDLAEFAALVATCSIGPYLLYSLREPRMIRQILSLSPGIRNASHNLAYMDDVVSQLVILLALLGVATIDQSVWFQWRKWPKEVLIAVFCAVSFVIAGFTDLQAGGSNNYYLEFLLAAVPLAVLGVLRLVDLARGNAVLGFALTSVLILHFLTPAAMRLYTDIGVLRQGWAQPNNAEFQKLEQALKGHRFFSVVPRLALLEPDPLLTEPYLMTYLHRLGKIDVTPIVEPVRRTEYELVITNSSPRSHRGVSLVDPTLRSAISDSYRPYCQRRELLFHLPIAVAPADSTLAQHLKDIGCLPIPEKVEVRWYESQDGGGTSR
jgi:hypothetical protein